MNQEQKLFAFLSQIPEKLLKYMDIDLKKSYEELISEIKKCGPAGVCVQVLTVVLQRLIQVPVLKHAVLALAPVVGQLQGKPVSELPEDIQQKVENVKKRVGEAIEETAKLQEEINTEPC